MKKVISIFLLALLLMLAALPTLLVSAQEDESASTSSYTLNPPEIEAGADVGFARFAHTAVDVGPLDIYLVGIETPIVSNLAYGEYTPFVTLPTLTAGWEARAAGDPIDAQPLFYLQWGVEANASWLIAAAGLAERGAFLLEPVNILRDAPAGDDHAVVRVVNMVWGAAPLGATLSEGEDGLTLATPLDYFAVSDTEVADDRYSLNITDGEGNVFASIEELNLDDDSIYTILIIGNAEDPASIMPLVMPARPHVTNVQVINQRGEPVEIFYRPGDEELYDDVLEPGETGELEDIFSDSVTFVAYAPGTGPDGQELASLATLLRPGRDLVIVVDDSNTMSIQEETLTFQIDDLEAEGNADNDDDDNGDDADDDDDDDDNDDDDADDADDGDDD